MKKKLWTIHYVILLAVSVGAQTTVTTNGGTTNSIPKFSGGTTLENSAITELNGMVGIGTTAPVSPLSVSGQIVIGDPYKGDASLHLMGSYGGFGRFIQVQPIGISQDALNLMASTNSTGIGQWWSWGVTQNSWRINPGYNFTSGPGVTINSLGNIEVGDSHLPGGSLFGYTGSAGGFLQGVGLNTYWNGANWTLRTDGGNNGGALIASNNGPGDIRFYTFNSTGNSMQTISNADLSQYQRMYLNSAGLTINGNLKLTSGSGASMTFADGTTQSTAWTGSLCGGDYAESVQASGDHKNYEPGDVLVLSDDNESDVSKSSQAYSTLVGGIYSTKPGLVGRRQIGEKNEGELPMAMVGIVPTKVSAENGSIHKGDLLVTSSTEGYAMKGTDRGRMLGAIVGKAMGALDSDTGVIEVLVSLQ